jgi:predicted nucleic acid-binding protein
MELIQGCRNKKELKQVTAFIRDNFHIVHCDKAISERAIALLHIHAHSHGLRTVDAIIASTALVHKAVLVTGNYRHFDMIKTLDLTRFDPR